MLLNNITYIYYIKYCFNKEVSPMLKLNKSYHENA